MSRMFWMPGAQAADPFPVGHWAMVGVVKIQMWKGLTLPPPPRQLESYWQDLSSCEPANGLSGWNAFMH